MKFKYLLLSCVSVLMLALPARAGKLIFWSFEPNQNQVFFTTDAGVQPKALLMSNPTRLIIDLPGINLGRPTVKSSFNGTIRSLRVGQFNQTTTRLVVEVSPGYTLNPQNVKVRGETPIHWFIQLPAPQKI